jgi:colicin import membrane protein
MKKFSSNYKTYFLYALGLHVILLIFFILNFAFSTQNYSPIKQDQSSIIEATTINQQQLNQEIAKIKNEKLAEQNAEKQKIERLENQAKQAEQKRLAEQARLQQLKQSQMAAQKQAEEQLNKLKQAQMAAQKQADEQLTKLKQAQMTAQKQAAEQLTKLKQQQQVEQERLTKLAKVKKSDQPAQQAVVKKNKIEEKNDAEKLLQQQLAKEQEELAASRQKFVDSIIAKYTALIKNAIAQKWIIPPGVDKSLSCVLLIHLLADGSVVTVEVNKSSGDTALDNSAVLAVKKASPLPMPDNADVLNQFKTLYLTVKPETVLEG